MDTDSDPDSTVNSPAFPRLMALCTVIYNLSLNVYGDVLNQTQKEAGERCVGGE